MKRLVTPLTCLLLLLGCDTAPADDRRTSLEDEAATLSCGATTAPVGISTASTMDAVGDAVIELPGEEGVANAYMVTLPEGVESYATFRVAVMHNDAALFVGERDRIVNLAPGGIPSSQRHGVCPDTLIDDYRTHIHEPGDYVLTFAADGPREFTLVAINTQIGHDPEGDGGMHMPGEDGGPHDHDGGMHMAGEDGGAHRDGGAHDDDGGHGEHDAG